MLNAVTGVNYIQSLFPQYKLQQPKVTKRLLTLHNIETNKINKKQR